MNAQAARTDVDLQLLEPMIDCAQALALRFGEAAKAEPDLTRALELDAAFQRGFLSVRMGIRLSLALRAPPRPARPAPVEREPSDREPLERETLDTERAERAERDEPDRDRDREYEPVSLPRFLSTLRGVAADATRLPATANADVLPTLKGLLARAEGRDAPPTPPTSAAGVTLLVQPPPRDSRTRLLGSASPPWPRVAPRPRPPPKRSG